MQVVLTNNKKERRDMGSKRRVVLASLVSLVMVIAFAIPLIPTTIPGAQAADNGHLDMVGLLKMVLGLEKAGEITLTQPADGAMYLAQTGQSSVDIALRSQVAISDLYPVSYKYNGTNSIGTSYNRDANYPVT